MSKTYSPKEVAAAVLKRCQELASQTKLVKKEIYGSSEEEERDAKDAAEEYKEKVAKPHSKAKEEAQKVKEKKEMEKCGNMSKSSHHDEEARLKTLNEKAKKEGKETIEEKTQRAASSNKMPEKLKDFIKNKKKKDLKKFMGKPQTSVESGSIAPPPPPAPGTSIADQIGFGKKEEVKKRCWEGYKPVKGKKAYSEGSCEKKSEEVEKCGDMKKEEVAAKKAVGLKPLVSDKVKAPNSDEMPKEPKAATTLKSFMMKRKK